MYAPRVDIHYIGKKPLYMSGLIFVWRITMTSGNMTRRFPLRPKAVSREAVAGKAMPPSIKPFLGAFHNKIVPFPSLPRERTKTEAAILNFPVRA